MPRDISISELSQDDTRIPNVISLINEEYRRGVQWSNAPDVPGYPRTTTEDFRRDMLKSTLLIAERDSEIVGIIMTGLSDESITRETKLPEACGFISLFAVDSSVRSQGVGKRLMKSAEEFCKRAGARRMSLEVIDARKDILSWYERMGYCKTGDSVDVELGHGSYKVECANPAAFLRMEKPLA